MKKKLLIGLPIIVALAAAGLTIASRNGGVEGVTVEVEKAGRRQVVQTVNATGKIQPMIQVNISADVGAKITRLEVEEGQWVERGEYRSSRTRAKLSATKPQQINSSYLT